VGLSAVWIVGRHVRLEVELPSEGTWALGTRVLATGVALPWRLVARAGVVVRMVDWDVRVCLGTCLDVLGRHIAVDEARVGAAPIVGRGLRLEEEAIGANVFVSGWDIKQRVGRRVPVCGRIIRDFTGGGARLALRRGHVEGAERVEVEVKLGVGEETMLGDSSTVCRERLVVKRLEAVVGELVVVAQRITRYSDSGSWTTVGRAVCQEGVDVEAVVWEDEGREKAVVDTEVIEFLFEGVGMRRKQGVDTGRVGTRKEPVEVRGLRVDRVGRDWGKAG